jgi:DNA-binding MarR family transcriptional regulator
MKPSQQIQPEEAFREVIAAYGLVTRLMHSHFAGFGISGAKWGVLRALHRAEAEGVRGMRMVDLGERLLVRPPSVTMLVGRLEREGLVAMEPSESDRRAKMVGLTRRGRELVERVLEVHVGKVRGIMSSLSAPEQAELQRMMAKLNGGIRGMIEAANGHNSTVKARSSRKAV